MESEALIEQRAEANRLAAENSARIAEIKRESIKASSEGKFFKSSKKGKKGRGRTGMRGACMMDGGMPAGMMGRGMPHEHDDGNEKRGAHDANGDHGRRRGLEPGWNVCLWRAKSLSVAWWRAGGSANILLKK
jgi:hypothetical protein